MRSPIIMVIEVTLFQTFVGGKIVQVQPKIQCSLDLSENYSTDILKVEIPKIEAQLEEALNKSLIH